MMVFFLIQRIKNQCGERIMQSIIYNSSSFQLSTLLINKNESIYNNKQQQSYRIQMDIYRLQEDIVFAEQIGCTLQTSERIKLELGLLRLTELANSDQLLFWGKIETTTKPYYLAVSFDLKGKYEFPHKKFYWSLNNFIFEQLPPILNQYKDKIQKFNHLPFTGNPKNILINVTGGEGGEQKQEIKKQQIAQVDSDEETVVKVEPINFTELDRLAYVVRAIQNDCQIVPVGAFRINQQHQLRYNDHFSGLSLKSGLDMKNYQLFRAPQSKQKREKIEKVESIFIFNFLDSIEGSKHWSLQYDSSKREVTLRNLYWPGYVGYHRSQTTIYGGVYIGDGSKRIDLPFYL